MEIVTLTETVDELQKQNSSSEDEQKSLMSKNFNSISLEKIELASLRNQLDSLNIQKNSLCRQLSYQMEILEVTTKERNDFFYELAICKEKVFQLERREFCREVDIIQQHQIQASGMSDNGDDGEVDIIQQLQIQASGTNNNGEDDEVDIIQQYQIQASGMSGSGQNEAFADGGEDIFENRSKFVPKKSIILRHAEQAQAAELRRQKIRERQKVPHQAPPQAPQALRKPKEKFKVKAVESAKRLKAKEDKKKEEKKLRR
jgi:hypothetical protein